jgi:hypothetical protein
MDLFLKRDYMITKIIALRNHGRSTDAIQLHKQLVIYFDGV